MTKIIISLSVTVYDVLSISSLININNSNFINNISNTLLSTTNTNNNNFFYVYNNIINKLSITLINNAICNYLNDDIINPSITLIKNTYFINSHCKYFITITTTTDVSITYRDNACYNKIN